MTSTPRPNPRAWLALLLMGTVSLVSCAEKPKGYTEPDGVGRDEAGAAEPMDGGSSDGGVSNTDATPGRTGTEDADGSVELDAGPRHRGERDAGGLAGMDGGTSDAADRCDVAVHDPADPPAVLELSGNLGTHDPTVIEQDGVFYELQTGGRQGLNGKVSDDLRSWRGTAAVLSPNPSWIADQVPEAGNLWAPDLSFFGGRYHVYYSASSFGSNYSCIGHAIRPSMVSGSWMDQGAPTLCSNHGSNDDWNAIDPDIVLEEDGTPWMSFGSFWSGVKLVELDRNGARASDELYSIASRGGGAIEAPVIVRRCGYYYLFVSFGSCCDGADSTYNIRVGRAEEVTGPYLDREGVPMMEGGGTLLVSGGGAWAAAGHNDVFFAGDRAYNVYHAYRASDGAPILRIAELVWDAQGWPVSGGP